VHVSSYTHPAAGCAMRSASLGLKTTIPVWGVFVYAAAAPRYGWLTSRFPRSVFSAVVYGLFDAKTAIASRVWFRREGGPPVDRARTISLGERDSIWFFVVAAFWSLRPDVFRREQEGRHVRLSGREQNGG